MSWLSVFSRFMVRALVLMTALSLVWLPATAGAQEQPKRGGTLVVALNAEPPNLNPGIGTDPIMLFVTGQIYNSLVRPDNDLGIMPELAEKWEISKDGLTYTFRLRQNVKWHDGKPLTAADVKFGLMDVNFKHNGLASTAFGMVESVDTPDASTVVFKLKYAYAPFFPWSFALTSNALVVPKHIYEGSDPTKNEYNFKPVGTGPFVFKEWVKGSHIILERNPDYFRPGQPYLDRLVLKIIPDNAARVIALEKGEVDYLPYFSLPFPAIGQLSKVEGVEVVNTIRAAHSEIIAFFNLRHPQLKVKEVRQAIATAVDRKALVDKAYAGRGTPGISPIPSQTKAFHNPNVPKYEPNVAKANQLLDQAGLPKKADGSRFSMRFSYQRGGEAGAFDSIGEVMREQLRAVGINLELQPMDTAALNESAFAKWDFDLTMGAYQTGPDPAIGVSRLYLTENIARLMGRNIMGYTNPKADQLFKTAERETDETKRATLYKDVQLELVEDMPALWLVEKVFPIANKKIVKGLPSGPMHSEPLDFVWLTTAEGGQAVPPTALIVAGAVAAAIVVGGVLVVRRVRST